MTAELTNSENGDGCAKENSEPLQAGESRGVGKAEHPLAAAICKLVHHARDVRFCGRKFIPQAAEALIHTYEKVGADLRLAQELLEGDARSKARGTRIAHNATRQAEHIEHSDLLQIVSRGLFLELFAVFDVFTGELLSAIYRKKPELVKKIGGSLTIEELLAYENIDGVKEIILQKEIDAFRRESYVEQFEILEKRFGLKLKAFPELPEFVELSQRRNLIAHCDGVVSSQYLSICKAAGFDVSSTALGEKLEVDPKYLLRACTLVIYVGVMLGQTLWRKIFPEELDAADADLIEVVFDFLCADEWATAISLSEFMSRLPKLASELNRRIYVVNHAIALKNSNNKVGALALLNKEDWTATSLDFRMAYAVLTDDYDSAAKLMKSVSAGDSLITEESYLLWPLFKSFRESPVFLKAFEEIYGYSFAEATLENAEKEIIKAGKNAADAEQVIIAAATLSS